MKNAIPDHSELTPKRFEESVAQAIFQDQGPQSLALARQAIARALLVVDDVPGTAKLAIWILRQMIKGRPDSDIPKSVSVRALYRSVEIALVGTNRCEDPFILTRDALSFARSMDWIRQTESGAFRLTKNSQTASREVLEPWAEAGLPERLVALASFLDSKGGEATAGEIENEPTVGVQPASLLSKYKARGWGAWIDRHIQRPKRGVFRII